MSCRQLHLKGDPRLGEPLCADCFDYEGQVVWNALAPELWRRTRIDIPWVLARLVGIKVSELERVVRLSYFKVAEYQLRGAVHFHAIIRLDAAPSPDDPKRVAPPPPPFSAELLAEAVRQSGHRVRAPSPLISKDRLSAEVRWGSELHIRNVSTDGPGVVSAKAVAFYVGKYATKNTEAMEGLDRTLTEVDVEALSGRPHIVRLVRTSWLMGNRPGLKDLKLQKRAHGLGFGGHWSTKSRRYSATFTALRRARREYVRRKRVRDGIVLDAWGRPEDEEAVVVLREWSYVGCGYQSNGERCWRSQPPPGHGRDGFLLGRIGIAPRRLRERKESA